MKYALILVSILLVLAVGREKAAEKQLVKIPEHIGAYTNLDIVWVNTHTYEISTESGEVYGKEESLAEALDFQEWITAQHAVIYDEIPKGSFTRGNFMTDRRLEVYRSINQESIAFIGYLYVMKQKDTETDYDVYQYKFQSETPEIRNRLTTQI